MKSPVGIAAKGKWKSILKELAGINEKVLDGRHHPCPVTGEGETSKSVYLPAGATWTDAWSNQVYQGGQTVTVDAPIGVIPLFVKDHAVVAELLEL